MKKIVLIGFMGCGKSSVGEALAQLTGWDVLDTDLQIEQEQGCTIRQLFAEKGEAYFRQLERELLSRLAKNTDVGIISTGGGLPIYLEDKACLGQVGIVVYLQVSPQEVLRRLAKDTSRPLLQREDKERYVQELLKQRDPIYASMADVIIQTEGKEPTAIAGKIWEQCGDQIHKQKG